MTLANDIDKTELKPCPFCGGEVTLITTTDMWNYISCKNENCGINPHTHVQSNKQAVIETWNKRAEEAEHEELSRNKRFLDLLEYYGVDNWCGYEDVKKMFLKEIQEQEAGK